MLPIIHLFTLYTLFVHALYPVDINTRTKLFARPYTVADRVKQYGEVVRKRWEPYFEKAGLEYPGERFTFIGLKEEGLLEVWVSDKNGKQHFIRSYPILAQSGVEGPKLRQGDGQVPEGLYRISFLNPNSRFHLSLRVNYPNAFDRKQAQNDSRSNLGGDIMIHGNAVSIGCLAMGDEAAEDLFILAAEIGILNSTVLLLPYDFRTKGVRAPAPGVSSWVPGLYTELHKAVKQYVK